MVTVKQKPIFTVCNGRFVYQSVICYPWFNAYKESLQLITNIQVTGLAATLWEQHQSVGKKGKSCFKV